MKILDFLHRETIIPNLKSNDKKGVLEELSLPVAEITGIPHAAARVSAAASAYLTVNMKT